LQGGFVNKQIMSKKVRILLFLILPLVLLTGFRYLIFAPATAESPAAVTSEQEAGKLEWLSLSEAQTRQAKDGKPILIDLYTDWCGWCKVMDRKTYARDEVAAYIRANFHPVKINAESKQSMEWRGKNFAYSPASRIHELAIFFTQGQLSFPHTIFMMKGVDEPQAIPGYLEVPDMELLLKFFGEGHFANESFSTYQKRFSPSWK
jgi:thioredoxin-related protein